MQQMTGMLWQKAGNIRHVCICYMPSANTGMPLNRKSWVGQLKHKLLGVLACRGGHAAQAQACSRHLAAHDAQGCISQAHSRWLSHAVVSQSAYPYSQTLHVRLAQLRSGNASMATTFSSTSLGSACNPARMASPAAALSCCCCCCCCCCCLPFLSLSAASSICCCCCCCPCWSLEDGSLPAVSALLCWCTAASSSALAAALNAGG